MNKQLGFITNTIHAGESKTSSSTPIHLGATSDARYLRSGNPTLDAFEEKVCTLEGGERAVSTASGMAAVSQTLLTLLKPGDRMVVHKTVYFWSTELIQVVLPRFGIDVEIIDMRDLEQVEKALEIETAVLYFEPLSNPTCDILDVKCLIQLGQSAGATVVIDNTFLSPALLNPLALGADIVLHSATKYLCGHGDALAGIIVANNSDLGEAIHKSRSIFGGILSPLNGYFLLRGIKTLSMRVERHCANAQVVAQFLSQNTKVAFVQYAGLPTAQGHEIAKSQWRNFGGMLNFTLIDNEAFEQFFQRVEIFKPWVSLGDAGSLAVGGENFGGPRNIRMSVGLEDIEDLLTELDYALA